MYLLKYDLWCALRIVYTTCNYGLGTLGGMVAPCCWWGRPVVRTPIKYKIVVAGALNHAPRHPIKPVTIITW